MPLRAAASAGTRAAKGGRLPRPLEARAPGRLPRDDVALAVGERHDRVVEAGLDVGLAHGDVLADAAAAGAGAAGSRHLVLAPLAQWVENRFAHFLVAFFLPATCMRRGPLRVRALVFVRWP